MSEMVERVAKALCVSEGLDPDQHVYGNQSSGFEDFGPRWQANQRAEGQLGATGDYVRQARAAIEAMREPTAAQISAVDEALHEHWPNSRKMAVAMQYAMIDAAKS